MWKPACVHYDYKLEWALFKNLVRGKTIHFIFVLFLFKIEIMDSIK